MRSTALHLIAGSLVLSLAALVGCKSDADTETHAATSRSYSGTASVGDFLTVKLDTAAHTMRYRNVTNGDDYTVPYTTGSDGTYHFTDTTGNLVAGYEVPGYAMVISATKAGPGKDTPAVITAIQTTTVTTDVFKSKSYNYMQFRTNSGGMELGHISCDASGNIAQTGYWPFGASQSSPDTFNNGDMPITGVVPNADHSALTLTMDEGHGPETNYIFATPAGFLAVDTPNGAIVCVQGRSSSAFDAASMAGTYKAILYSKEGCSTMTGNVEHSTSQSVDTGTLVISSAGHITVRDAGGTTLVDDKVLTPLADRADIVGTHKLEDPCAGTFSFTLTDGGGTRDVFLSFLNDAVLIASYTAHAPNDYDYFYGVGLRGLPTGIGALPHAASAALAASSLH